MKNRKKLKSALRLLNNFFIFFFLVGFVITCCTLLFVSTLRASLGIVFTEENIASAAKITFLNVLILSFVFFIIDTIRRHFTVKKPIERIAQAAKRMTKGDFSVRIKPLKGFGADESFNRVIECFNGMARELAGVETLRTDFIANVSHEMKTPLSAIQNYATLLQAPDLTEEKRLEYTKAISGCTRRMSDMMTNILKLNRLENRNIYPLNEEFDLSAQLCECMLEYEGVWESAGIDIEANIAEAITVRGDSELLRLVWSNLLSNAFKFTPEGGKVTLEMSVADGFVTVKIADTGCGMTPEVGSRIFEKFYQGDTSHSAQGNGLGLALVKRVIDILQGEIKVESKPGKGSVFTVKLKV